MFKKILLNKNQPLVVGLSLIIWKLVSKTTGSSILKYSVIMLVRSGILAVSSVKSNGYLNFKQKLNKFRNKKA